MTALGHSRRFVRVRGTSGYPLELTVKANWQALGINRHARERRDFRSGKGVYRKRIASV
jgi:hypothetical protein